jgi:hypothetical protein
MTRTGRVEWVGSTHVSKLQEGGEKSVRTASDTDTDRSAARLVQLQRPTYDALSAKSEPHATAIQSLVHWLPRVTSHHGSPMAGESSSTAAAPYTTPLMSSAHSGHANKR